MNELFCSIGQKLAADIAPTSNPLPSKESSINSGGRIFDFRAINEIDIYEAISRIKVKKGFGKNTISGCFQEIALSFISRILVIIFTSIEIGTFRVTPIYKEGEKSEKLNYRPKPMLAVLSGLFEKRIYVQLYKYLERGLLLTADQSGFRALHSSPTSLLQVTNDR